MCIGSEPAGERHCNPARSLHRRNYKAKKTQTAIGWGQFWIGSQREGEKEQGVRSYIIISPIYLVTMSLPIALGKLTPPFLPKIATQNL